jgi:hypothetical protein
VADFHCAACHEDFELKSKKGAMGPKVADGAYGAKRRRLASDTNPNLALMSYDLARFAVTDLFIVPKQFFTAEIIEERSPLAATARRAGWIGSNIVLREVPASGKVWVVRGGETMPREAVLEQWRATLFLRETRPSARGWLIEVMKCPRRASRAALLGKDWAAGSRQLQPGRHVRLRGAAGRALPRQPQRPPENPPATAGAARPGLARVPRAGTLPRAGRGLSTGRRYPVAACSAVDLTAPAAAPSA